MQILIVQMRRRGKHITQQVMTLWSAIANR